MPYDAIVIGAGPAGLAASIYLARQRLRFCVISKDIGGQTLLSSDVENYLGFHLLSGSALVRKFTEHLEDYGIELHESEEALELSKSDDLFVVRTNKASYTARAVLIATGKLPRKLDVPGEKELYGKGVTYCAVCDAPLFKGKEVAVIGGGNSAMDAALFAEKYSPKVYIINIAPELKGDALLIEKVKASSKIVLINNARTTAILGDGTVSALEYERAGKRERLAVQGIFVEIGLIPSSGFAKEVAKNEAGEIIVDKHNMTSIPGIFGAGDVTDVCEKQIAIAVGEGSKAALDLIEYLQKTG